MVLQPDISEEGYMVIRQDVKNDRNGMWVSIQNDLLDDFFFQNSNSKDCSILVESELRLYPAKGRELRGVFPNSSILGGETA
jgi:hypothetical protein